MKKTVVGFASVMLTSLSFCAVMPISQWSFEDETNLGIDSKGSNNLTAKLVESTTYDTPKIYADGHLGNAVDFRRSSSPVGNAYLGVADGLPKGTTPFSLSLWIKPCANTSWTGYIIAYLGITGGVPGGWTVNNTWNGWWLRFAKDGKLAWCFNGWHSEPSASSYRDVVGAIPSGAYKDGKWHQIVMTRDANKVARLYWDGRKIGESTITYSIPDGRCLLIGSYESGNGYDGYYDEIELFGEVLTDGQIVQKFFEGNANVKPDEDGRIVLDADAGVVVTNQISYDPPLLQIEKTGAGTVLLYHGSGNYDGTVKASAGLLRTGEIGTLRTASAFEVANGATMEFGRSGDYAAPLSGAGAMRFTGHGVYNLTGGLGGFSGVLGSYFGTVNFGTAETPIIPTTATALDVDGGGFLNFFGDVSVASLSGSGLLGGVAVPDGHTLTVAGTADADYAGRLVGKGSLVKNGTGTLTLSGESAFSNLTVNAGAVALASAMPSGVKYRTGLCGYWNFDDPAAIGADGSLDGTQKLVDDGYGNYKVELVADGVSGKAVHIVQPNQKDGDCFFLRTEGPGKLPSGTASFTVSAWIRPRGNLSGYCYLLRRSDFSGSVAGGWSHNWANSWMISSTGSGTRMTFQVMSGWVDAGTDTKAAAGAVDFSLNTWHHVVGTREGRVWKLYFDGQLVGSYTHSSDHSISSNAKFQVGSYGCHDQPSNAIAADYDEIQYLAGAWTAEEVAAEYAARKPKSAIELPAPLAHWTFDEFETDEHGRFFRDHSASGWHFYEVKKDAKSVACIDSSHAAGQDVNGGAAYVDSNNGGAYLKVGDHVVPKSTFSNKNPDFTLSVRLRNVTNSQPGRQIFLSFGSAQAGASCFRLSSESQKEGTSGTYMPRIYRIFPGTGDSLCTTIEDTYNTCGDTTPWTTLTFVNDAAAKKVTIYRDGKRVGEGPTAYSLDLDRILVYAGYNYNTYNGYAVDDLRVYRTMLNDPQIALLAREQAGVTGGPVDTAAVNLAASTTLDVKGGTHVAASVAGDGDVTVAAGAAFGARDYAGFNGAISGSGALALAAKVPAGVTVSLTEAVFPNDTIELTLAAEETPFVSFAGKVTLPQKGTIRLLDAVGSESWAGRLFALATCTSYEGPAVTTGWTFEPPLPESVKRNRFVFSNGVLSLKTGGRGSVIIIR